MIMHRQWCCMVKHAIEKLCNYSYVCLLEKRHHLISVLVAHPFPFFLSELLLKFLVRTLTCNAWPLGFGVVQYLLTFPSVCPPWLKGESPPPSIMKNKLLSNILYLPGIKCGTVECSSVVPVLLTFFWIIKLLFMILQALDKNTILSVHQSLYTDVFFDSLLNFGLLLQLDIVHFSLMNCVVWLIVRYMYDTINILSLIIHFTSQP